MITFFRISLNHDDFIFSDFYFKSIWETDRLSDKKINLFEKSPFSTMERIKE